jgi:NADPH:quinone reductase-like Zn-dependent oxidoreductase
VLRPGGTLVAVPSGASPEVIEKASALGVNAMPFLVEPDGPALAQIARLIDAGKVEVEVEQVFPLAEVAAAHERMESGRTQGKLVVRVA